jgi:hypothetical protein
MTRRARRLFWVAVVIGAAGVVLLLLGETLASAIAAALSAVLALPALVAAARTRRPGLVAYGSAAEPWRPDDVEPPPGRAPNDAAAQRPRGERAGR